MADESGDDLSSWMAMLHDAAGVVPEASGERGEPLPSPDARPDDHPHDVGTDTPSVVSDRRPTSSELPSGDIGVGSSRRSDDVGVGTRRQPAPSLRWPVLGAAAVAVVIVGAILVGSHRSGHAKVAVGAARTTTTAATAGMAATSTAAEAKVITLALDDLTPGFVELDDPLPEDGYRSGPCQTQLRAGNGVGASSEFSFKLNQQGEEKGHLISTVFVAPSAQAAAKIADFIGSASYPPCAAAGSRSVLVAHGVSNVGTSTTSTVPIDAGTGVRALHVRVSTPYEFGGSKLQYEDLVHLYAGRLEEVIDVTTCCQPWPDSDLTRMVERVSSRMRQSPLGQA